MSALKIVLGCVVAAILYGIVHDLVTAHVCVEYFTVAHRRVIESESPVALALVWGVIATWGVGLGLGTLLALAARGGGSRPPIPPAALVRPVLTLLGICAVCALLAGLGAYAAASAGLWRLRNALAEQVPAGKHAAFLGVAWAHLASYGVGVLGGVLLAMTTWRLRGRLADKPPPPTLP